VVPSFQQAYQEQQYTYHFPLHTNFPFTWYQQMRAIAPIFYDESLHAWSFFLAEDIQKALADVGTFSSRMALAPGEPVSLSRSDPPWHQQLRALVSQAMTPRGVAVLAPLIEQCVTEILDPLLEREHIDGIKDLAAPIPVAVISRLLGVPPSDREQLRGWIEEGLSQRNPQLLRTNPLRPGMAQVRAYFTQRIQERRRRPQHDLISEVVQATDAGGRFDDEQLAGLLQSLYVAGHLTTINLIGNSLLCLHAYPDVQRQVRHDPSLIAGTIEEVLRYCGPVQSLGRLVAHDVEIGGQRLHAGETALFWIGSANHDEQAFKDPTRFEITRRTNKHLAFGRGIHFCLGAPLARLEVQIALRLLLERTEQIELESSATLSPFLVRSSYGVKELPLTIGS
jgi:cytochrome P450